MFRILMFVDSGLAAGMAPWVPTYNKLFSEFHSIWKSFPKLRNSIIEKTICTHKLWASVSVFLPWNFMDCYLTWIEMGGFLRETGQEVTAIRFRARLVVLSLLGFLLYPFLWVWTVIGSMWFTKTQACVKSQLNFWTCPSEANVNQHWDILDCITVQKSNGLVLSGFVDPTEFTLYWNWQDSLPSKCCCGDSCAVL
jgi:hypothetical protein